LTATTGFVRRAAARLAANEYWLLWVYGAPLLFASNIPSWLLAAGLATIPFFWIARRIARGAWSITTAIDLPLLVLVLTGLVGTAFSSEMASSLLFYAQLVGGIALYYGMVNGLRELRRGLWVLLALGTGMGLVSLLGLRYDDAYLPLGTALANLPRERLAFLNPDGFTANIVAGALAPIVPVALAVALTPASKRVRLLAGFITVGLLVVVFLTQSRGALFALMTALVLVLAMAMLRLRWVVLGLVLGTLVILYLGQTSGLGSALLAGDSTGSLQTRLELWDRALLILRDFPFTGIGAGTFERTVLTMYPLFQNRPGVPLPHVHNLFLQFGVDSGIGSLVAFTGFVVTTLLVGLTLCRREESTSNSWLALGLFAGYLVIALHGLLDAIFVSTKVSVVGWLITALLMVLYGGERREFAQ
jgi:O-antigen ligase